jgi:hypothetical protein
VLLQAPWARRAVPWLCGCVAVCTPLIAAPRLAPHKHRTASTGCSTRRSKRRSETLCCGCRRQRPRHTSRSTASTSTSRSPRYAAHARPALPRPAPPCAAPDMCCPPPPPHPRSRTSGCLMSATGRTVWST